MKKHIKIFLSFYRPYTGLFVVDMICAVLSCICALIIPLNVGYITEHILSKDFDSLSESLIKAGGFMVFLILVQAAASFFMDARGHAMGAMMERDVRRDMFIHLESLSFGFYDQHRVGELMSRITNDSLLLTEFFHHFPEDVAVNTIKLAGAVIILFGIHPALTLIMLFLLPFMTIYTLYFTKRMKKALIKGREKIASVNGQVEDSLSGIHIVQSFVNEDMERKKFEKENNEFLECRKKGYESEAFCYGGAETFAALMPLIVIVAGGFFLGEGSLSLPQLFIFLLYVNYFTAPIQSLIHMTQQFQEGMAGFSRFLEIIETKPQITDRKGARPLEKAEGQITFEHVDFSYEDGASILTDISLSIEPGEHLAVVGSSGGGKSTLCSLIPRFYDVTGGRVALDGKDVRDITLSSLRKQIGVVEQQVYLFSGTLFENIQYGKPKANLEEVEEAAKKAGIHEFVVSLKDGYNTDIGPRGIKLSGGQRQRISIARVFLKNPPILILDEATSSLDQESERLVQKSLEELSKNRTTIVIAHRLSTIQNARRILVLSDKKIAEQGTHRELLKKGGEYKKLYEVSLL